MHAENILIYLLPKRKKNSNAKSDKDIVHNTDLKVILQWTYKKILIRKYYKKVLNAYTQWTL